MTRVRRVFVKTVVVTVLEVVFLIIFWTWACSAILFLRNTFLPRLQIAQTPELFGLPSETVHFTASDGLRLEGWKIPADPRRPWILLCHGVGSNRSDLLEIASGLHAARFNLFLFDFRGHGGSTGRATSFGWQEQRDLEGALAFLGQQPDVPARPYGVYGISMGAATALMVAARDERIGAVAADSPYNRLDKTLERHLELMYPVVPKAPFFWFIQATYRLRFGVWPRRVSPEDSASRLNRRPLLLIQGAQDPRTPLAGTRGILANATGPKALWVIEGAGHLEGFSLNPQVYLARLVDFFNSSLKESI